MKQRSQAVLASAILAAGSAAAAAAAAAEPPLKTLPSQQDIWITGTILRGPRTVHAGRPYVATAGPAVNFAM